MIFSGLWLLIFIIIHVRTFKYGPDYEAADGVRDLYRLEMENFRSPLTVGLLCGQHARGRFARLARRVEQRSSRSASITPGGRPASWQRRRCWRPSSPAASSIIVLWAHLMQFAGQVGQ